MHWGLDSKARIPAMPPHCFELMLEMIATLLAHFEDSLLVGFSSVRTVGFFSQRVLQLPGAEHPRASKLAVAVGAKIKSKGPSKGAVASI